MAAPLGMVDYNGVNLKIDHIRTWETAPVYSPDNCDRLYLHHRIAVECWWNPEATRSAAGKLGMQSIAEVRQALLRERRSLKITIGGVVVLQSPLPKPRQPGKFFKTDARNGPLPVRLSVLSITGDKTVKAVFEIETWVGLACPANDSQGIKQQSVLSHRWDMSERIDDTFLSTRTVRGTATFRTDFLLENGDVPDDFRARLSHPIPPFFKREAVSVTAKSDGTAVDYTFEDRETPGVNLLGGTNGVIAKVRGTWRYGWASAGRGVVGMAADEIKSALGLSSRFLSVTIQAWGRRRAAREDLVRAVINGVRAFGFDDIRSPHAFQNMALEVDLWDKFAQLTAGIFLDGALVNLIAIASKVAGAGFGSSQFGFGVGVGPGGEAEAEIRKQSQGGTFDPISKAHKFLTADDFPDEIKGLTTTEDVRNPRPPVSDGTRGSSLETMVAQTLLDQCGTPAVPIDTAYRQDLSVF